MERVNRFPRELICSSATDGFRVLCPYNYAHQLLERSFGDHIVKCRRFYEAEKVALGDMPQRVPCRYNRDHKIFAPELYYHEHGCEDKNLPWLEQLYLRNVKLFEEIANLDEAGLNARLAHQFKARKSLKVAGGKNTKPGKGTTVVHVHEPVSKEDAVNAEIFAELLEAYKETPDHLLQMRSGPSKMKLLADRAIKMAKERPFAYMGDVMWADPTIAKEQGYGGFCKPSGSGSVAVVPVADQGAAGGVDDDEEDWNDEPGSGVKFDWWEHQLNTMKRTGRIPPGVTKGQRKQLQEINKIEKAKRDVAIAQNRQVASVTRTDNDPIPELWSQAGIVDVDMELALQTQGDFWLDSPEPKFHQMQEREQVMEEHVIDPDDGSGYETVMVTVMYRRRKIR